MDDAKLVKCEFSSVPIELARFELLEKVHAKFGWRLLCYGWFPLDYRCDVSMHGFHHERWWEGFEMTDGLRDEIRRFINGRDWHFSRNLEANPAKPGNTLERIFLAPMVPVVLETAYHATRRTSEASIRASGLLPSSPDRQTTADRLDCEGNIYVCEKLGVPSDASAKEKGEGAGSAYWWKNQLADKNRFNDRDWMILKINLKELAGCRAVRDIWSPDGIIIDNVDCVPSNLIEFL